MGFLGGLQDKSGGAPGLDAWVSFDGRGITHGGDQKPVLMTVKGRRSGDNKPRKTS